MLNNTTLQINIAGTPISSFTHLTLRQSINSHHTFEITMNVEAAEQPDTHTLERTKDWLGKQVTIVSGEKTFIGIAAHVGLHREKGNHGSLIVSGYSRTFLLESDPHLCSWTDKSLSSIVKSITEKASLKSKIKPEYTAKIEYESQYMETHFGFILRLAKQYREWCYYDGEQLIFGKPDKSAPVKLEYGRDLSDLDICIQTLARSVQGFSFNSSSVEKHLSATPDAPQGLGELGQRAFNNSLSLFKIPANQFSDIRTKTKSDLDDYLRKKQQSDSAASHYITGRSDRHGLSVGSIVDVHTAIHLFKTEFITQSHGLYIITDIAHYAGEGGVYYNTFTALPAGIPSLPEPDVPLPLAQTQMATVISNNDPKKKGRVQVKMHWQTGEMRTSWIRVLTPDAGSSGKVSSNRGFVFIPEEGDQVLVGFRYNDPNRPFVMGSLFNGNSGGGGGNGNKTKSLTTRSGSTISLDDDKGSVTLRDPKGSTVVLNGDNTITVSAKEKIIFEAKEILLNAEQKVIIDGKDEVNVTSKKTAFEGTQKVEIKSDTKISEEAPAVEISATATAKVEGATVDINGKVMTNVKGGTAVNLN